MRTVVEESEGTSTAGGIVNDLSHHRTILLKEELITDTDLTGRLHEHVPQTQFLVEFTQQEHLDLGISLLLGTIQTGRKHLGIVEDKGIVLVEIVEHIAEVEEDGFPLLVEQILSVLIFLGRLDALTLTVNHHQTTFITMITRLKSHQILR